MYIYAYIYDTCKMAHINIKYDMMKTQENTFYYANRYF